MNEANRLAHPFDQAIELTGEPGRRMGKVSADYQNMVGPFGGITAAKILNAVMTHPQYEGSPVSLTVNYLGPIKDEGVEIDVTLLRANRSNQHWSLLLRQGDDVQCSATCVVAKRRETWQGEEVSCPQAPPYQEVAALQAFPGMSAWIQQYDLRFVHGGLFEKANDDGTPLSESLLWMADKPKRALDFASLTAIADAFFPRVLIRRKKMVPCGTVSFTVHFHATLEDLANLESPVVLGHARASKFSGNYFDQTAELWSETKTLLATTSQMVYYKE